MRKNPTTINFSRTVLDYIASESSALGLKNSPYVESIIMTYAFTNGFKPITSEIENLRKGFLVNNYSNITGDFRQQISTFNPSGQTAVIAFIYRLNLIKGFRISTRRMANLFKDEEVCYFALGRIGRSQQFVNDYLRSYSLNTATIGISNAADNEYLFLSNYQQFRVIKPYPKFAQLLNLLNLPPGTNVIKVHYNQLMVIADAFAKL